MRPRYALIGLVCLALLGCGRADEPSASSEKPAGDGKTIREAPSTTLQPGEEVTYLPGEVVPGKTTIRCRRGGQVVPRPGEGAIAIYDAAPGSHGMTVRVATLADGTVKASCA